MESLSMQTYGIGVELGLDLETFAPPVNLPEVLLAGTACVSACSVDLYKFHPIREMTYRDLTVEYQTYLRMTMRQEGIQDGLDVLQVVHTRTWLYSGEYRGSEHWIIYQMSRMGYMPSWSGAPKVMAPC